MNSKKTDLEIVKHFSSSTQVSMKFMIFILLINVEMPTTVGITTFISRLNTTLENFKERKIYTFHYYTFYEQLIFHAQLSVKKVL